MCRSSRRELRCDRSTPICMCIPRTRSAPTTPIYNLSYGRDVAGLDVIGYTVNDFNITEANWDEAVAADFRAQRTRPLRLLSGTEWCGNSAAGGDSNVVFLRDGKPRFPFDEEGRSVRSFEWNEITSGTIEPGVWPVDELCGGLCRRPGGAPADPACRRSTLHSRLASSGTGASRRGHLLLGPVPLGLHRCAERAAIGSAPRRPATSTRGAAAAARRRPRSSGRAAASPACWRRRLDRDGCRASFAGAPHLCNHRRAQLCQPSSWQLMDGRGRQARSRRTDCLSLARGPRLGGDSLLRCR